jgi:hypothetical protein
MWRCALRCGWMISGVVCGVVVCFFLLFHLSCVVLLFYRGTTTTLRGGKMEGRLFCEERRGAEDIR